MKQPLFCFSSAAVSRETICRFSRIFLFILATLLFPCYNSDAVIFSGLQSDFVFLACVSAKHNRERQNVMRKCIRCDAEMIEKLDIREQMNFSILRVTRPETSGFLPKNYFGDVKAAVCPHCGYLETYLSRLDRIQQYHSR